MKTFKLSLFVTLLLSQSLMADSSFFEISKENRSKDVVCISNESQANNPRVKQLVSILKEIDEVESGALTSTDEYPTFLGNCFYQSKIPHTLRYIPVEIMGIIQGEQFDKIHKQVEIKENNPDLKFSKKKRRKELLKTELLITLGQLIEFGYLLSLPRNFTKWDENGLWKNAPKKFAEAWTKPPKWDKDGWVVNYISHPYSGSLYYNAIRDLDYTPLQSFIYTTYKSAFWEYIVESWVETPSIQDLIFTPIGGALIGEASYQLTQKMKKGGFNFLEKVIVTITNPTYVLRHGYKTK